MVVKRLRFVLYLITILTFIFSNASAAEISLHGFLQGNYSADTAASNPNGGDFKLAEERLQLKLDASKDPFHIFVKADGWYDHIDQKWDSELREGYLDYTSSKWDARIGRQIITWGVGDLLFINDVFPKDYAAFFSGRPLEYLKKGIDAAKVGVYPGFASFELIATPFLRKIPFRIPRGSSSLILSRALQPGQKKNLHRGLTIRRLPFVFIVT